MLCICSSWGFPAGSDGKESACNVGDLGSIPGSRRSPGEGNGNPLQILAWEIPWTEEPGGLQSTGSQRVVHHWATSLSSSLCSTYFVLMFYSLLEKGWLTFFFHTILACFCFKVTMVYKIVLRNVFLFSWKSLFSWTCLKNHPSLLLPFCLHCCETNRQAAAAAKSLQSCPTLCDPIDGSPPGSPVPEILQARTLEWVAIAFSNAWKWKVKWSRSVMSDS